MDLKNQQRIIVKFHSGSKMGSNDQDEILKFLLQGAGIVPAKFLELYPGIHLKKLFSSMATPDLEERFKKKIEKAKFNAGKKGVVYEDSFDNFIAIDYPEQTDWKAMIKDLKTCHRVELAYPEALAAPPPSISPGSDPLLRDQKYMQPSPLGVDIQFAWTIAGGDGNSNTTVKFIDVEQGWNLNHEDLRAAGVNLLDGLNRAYKSHGTKVLGTILAQNNNVGGIGITPFAKTNVVSEWNETAASGQPVVNTADAIRKAVTFLDDGDILLVEAQKSINNRLLPVEVDPAIFDAIRFGTRSGVIIIVPAANGTSTNPPLDLDDFQDDDGKFIFNRNHDDFRHRDSGAIMVGAAKAILPHKRHPLSNFGSRVDCYAWGNKVPTASTNEDGTSSSYVSNFSLTSASSAIVAGVAISVQSMFEKTHGIKCDPFQMRQILSDVTIGTPSKNGTRDKIGVMPDISKIWTKYIRPGIMPGDE